MNHLELSFSDTLSIKMGAKSLLCSSIPRLAFRNAGKTDWQFEVGTLIEGKQKDKHIRLKYAIGPIQALLTCKRLTFDSWLIESELLHSGSSPVELARFHCIDGVLAEKPDLLSVSEHREGSRRFTPRTSVPSGKGFIEELWGQHGVSWKHLNDPIHMQSNWGTSTDVGILLNGWQDIGLVIGFTGPGVAWGEIGYGTCREGDIPFFAAMLLDNILLAPGEHKALDRLFIRYGDWQESMNIWARRCAEQMEAKPVRQPLVGFCSWYQKDKTVTEEDILKATADFADWPIPPGGRTIQIDAGFQIMDGNWRPNDRFKKMWDCLPARIAETGSIPGLWLAPTRVYENHPIVLQHPEWIQRLPDGNPAVSFPSSGTAAQTGKTYFLDPDHPGAQSFMADVIADAVARGWRYLKLDFTYAVSTARVAYDRRKTTFETFRDLYRLFRRAAGPDSLICACVGGLHRYTIGLADTVRIGGDIGASFQHIRRNLPDMLLRMWPNGVWWLADPDVFYMREENSVMTADESRLLTGTIGMLGGVFLTSDYASQWNDDARRFVRYFWNKTGPIIPHRIHAIWSLDGVPTAIRVTIAPSIERIASYNWSNTVCTISIALAQIGLKGAAKWKLTDTIPEDPAVVLEKNTIICKDQPAHSIRIVTLVH